MACWPRSALYWLLDELNSVRTVRRSPARTVGPIRFTFEWLRSWPILQTDSEQILHEQKANRKPANRIGRFSDRSSTWVKFAKRISERNFLLTIRAFERVGGENQWRQFSTANREPNQIDQLS